MVGARALDAPDELVSTVDYFLEGDQVSVDACVARVCRAADQLLLACVEGGLLPVLAQARGVVPLVAFCHLALEHGSLSVLKADKTWHVLLPAEAAHKCRGCWWLRHTLTAQVE